LTGSPALRSVEDRRAAPAFPEPRRINVLFLVESMEVAGAEQVVLSLAQGLDRARFRPLVGCLVDEGPLAEILRRDRIPVFALGKRPGFDVSVVRRLMRVLRDEQVDVVHTHVWNADVWGRFSAWLARVPVRMMTAHSVDVWKTRAHLAVDWGLARVSDHVVCVSAAVRDFYHQRAGVPDRKLSVILNGIDAAPFDAPVDVAAKRRELGVPVEGPLCSVIARLLPEKGHRFMVAAMPRIREAFPHASLLVVGNGATRADLEKQARDLGLLDAGVRLLGERRDVPEILKASDVFVLPSSVREGLSISLLEAMASRRPVVVTDVGGNRETVGDGKSGIVVPPADSDALADGVLRVLRDPALARRLGDAARARVDGEFGVARMVRQTEDLYEGLLAGKRT
jgi:glycosyltransferase involved in cell wall biosynthesis